MKRKIRPSSSSSSLTKSGFNFLYISRCLHTLTTLTRGANYSVSVFVSFDANKYSFSSWDHELHWIRHSIGILMFIIHKLCLCVCVCTYILCTYVKISIYIGISVDI